MRQSIARGAAALALFTSFSARAAGIDHARWLAPREALYQDLTALTDAVAAKRPVAAALDHTLGRLMNLNVDVRRMREARRRAVLTFVIGGALDDVVSGGRAATAEQRRTLRRVLLTLEAQSDFERGTLMRAHLRRRLLRAGLSAALVGLAGTYVFEFVQAYVDWRVALGVCPADPAIVDVALTAVEPCSDLDLLAGLVTRNFVAAGTLWGVVRFPGRRRLSQNHVRPRLTDCVRALDVHEAGGPIL